MNVSAAPVKCDSAIGVLFHQACGVIHNSARGKAYTDVLPVGEPHYGTIMHRA